MVDMLADVSEHDSRRIRQAADLEKAMRRTQRLLESDAARVNPVLATTWQERLERQQENLTGLLRK